MRIKLSNGNWLAVEDGLDQKIVQAMVDVAEEELADKAVKARVEKELEIPKIKRGR